MVAYYNLDYFRAERRWVGYCNGKVYRIQRRPEGWRVYPADLADVAHTFSTLAEVSAHLAGLPR